MTDEIIDVSVKKDNVNEIIEHEIVIEGFGKLLMDIPKRLSTLELQALMTKTKKLFNISETTISGSRRSYERNYGRTFTTEMCKDIEEQLDSGFKAKEITQFLNDKYNTNLSKEKVANKIWYLRKSN